MRTWAFMLSGLAVWALHFMGVYAIASAFDLTSRAETPAARWSVAAFSLACAAANVAILLYVGRRDTPSDPVAAWVRSVAALGALVSLIAVSWQALPSLLIS